MNFNEIKEIIDYVSNSGISKLNLEIEGVKIYIENDNRCEEIDKKTESKNKEETINEKIIIAPMVGACHIANKGDGTPKAKGDFVEVGEIICVIEAMKIFNEVKSDYKGVIEEVLFNDGDIVEYSKPLFKIKPL